MEGMVHQFFHLTQLILIHYIKIRLVNRTFFWLNHSLTSENWALEHKGSRKLGEAPSGKKKWRRQKKNARRSVSGVLMSRRTRVSSRAFLYLRIEGHPVCNMLQGGLSGGELEFATKMVSDIIIIKMSIKITFLSLSSTSSPLSPS